MAEQRSGKAMLEDYRLEDWLRCPYRYARKRASDRRADRLHWRQLAQYAISHTVNGFYQLPVQSRKREAINRLLEGRWTNKVDSFESATQYEHVKALLKVRLYQLLLGRKSFDGINGDPIIAFERFETYVQPLGTTLSVIFHSVFGEADGRELVIRKYTVNADRDISEAFRHLVTVFGYYAFGRVPSRIEVHALLDGTVQCWQPDAAAVCASVDYLRLLLSFEMDEGGIRKSGDAAECRTCPLRGDCLAEGARSSVEEVSPTCMPGIVM
ncbi:conserved hypothetical protein [Paenibacillus curdlanolyticus YK9]|uniref:PD-(D/E)XK endonuclease-like domain-containing protein n=1 Tax=Paenibacillus curdlanolyticus YK9 TaxID=717606 RepID=E0IB57_9BACL|nr:hypothetical protein [Paenibacillus curdlanolyticus]EFM10348.1 conserved hypothetical protein [Paenibacillus curdlanolyticus YK9]